MDINQKLINLGVFVNRKYGRILSSEKVNEHKIEKYTNPNECFRSFRETVIKVKLQTYFSSFVSEKL
jgi:hypothetical protein